MSKNIYRMVHKNNLDYIFQTQKLCSAKHPEIDPDYKPIGETTLIRSRSSKKIIMCGKLYSTLEDYIPFYFGPRPPMLYAIQHGFDVPQIGP